MDKINGIDMEVIFKKRGHPTETDRLLKERNRILQPQRTRLSARDKKMNAFRTTDQPNRTASTSRKEISSFTIGSSTVVKKLEQSHFKCSKRITKSPE